MDIRRRTSPFPGAGGPIVFLCRLEQSPLSSIIGKMRFQVTALLALAGAAQASWTSNINYRSPSEHHPSLGVSIHRVVKRNDPQSPWDPAKLNFTHGVASGDPYPDSVILWTRVSPVLDNDKSNITVSGYVPLYNHDTQEYISLSKAPICVEYKVASDEQLGDVVDSGTVYTSSDIDYTVKVRRIGTATVDMMVANSYCVRTRLKLRI